MTDPIRDALTDLVALAESLADATSVRRHERAIIKRARAALAEPPAPSVPSVPREPTPEMFDAALPNGNAWTAGTIWRAMYDAAPTINGGEQAAAARDALAEPPAPSVQTDFGGNYTKWGRASSLPPDPIPTMTEVIAGHYDQPGGGAVAPEQAKAEKAGVAPGPPDPTAAPAQSEPHDYDALVSQLRDEASQFWMYTDLWGEAANAIAALRAENERQAREIRTLRNVAVTVDERAERAEAERDALRAELAEDAGGWARAERAEAERDALRAALRQIYFLDHNEREWESVQEVKLFAERAAIDAARKV